MDQAVRVMVDRKNRSLTFTMVEIKGGIKIMLDINSVLTTEETGALEKAA